VGLQELHFRQEGQGPYFEGLLRRVQGQQRLVEFSQAGGHFFVHKWTPDSPIDIIKGLKIGFAELQNAIDRLQPADQAT